MERRTVELRIGGQNYRVASTAGKEDLGRLAQVVEAKLATLAPKGRPIPPQTMLLAAIALAHDLQEERDRRESLERRTRDTLRRVLVRIDRALESGEEEPAIESE